MAELPYTPDVPRAARVKSSERLWSQECADVDASDILDAPGPGAAGLEKMLDQAQPVAYEFGKRKFRAKRNPYE